MPTGSQDKSFAERMQDHAEITMSNATLDEAIDWIANELSPDDVFPDDKLEKWAESNGYTKEQE